MRLISPPPVPYHATAQRPDWSDLPRPLRTVIADRLGAEVVQAVSAGGGFTRGFAAVLHTATGERAFVKAASVGGQPHLADWYAREAAIASALPAPVPAARPRWVMTAAGFVVVCLDAIDGHLPALPWDPDELTATLRAWAVAAEQLRQPPASLVTLGHPHLADLLRVDLAGWQEVVGGRQPMPPAPPVAAARLGELAALEAALPVYASAAGPALTHCDLRLDNVLIDTGGAAWLCDWNWLCFGPAWVDTAILLITAYASGLDADRLFADHPTARDAPADALDVTLAAMTGYYLTRAAEPPPDASAALRAHQRWSGEQALAWLAERQGW